MNKKEYLRQAYLLDKRIKADMDEVVRLRELATSVSSLRYDREYVQTTRSVEAPFVKALIRVMDLEAKINMEITLFISLKEQILEVISKLESVDEQMILRYRYMSNMTWEDIGNELHAGVRTVIRWHGNALEHLVFPENPIRI
ncbi:RNA polymerase subunit sigma-70 [Gardnerella pickettii]|uniref:RNA polymerase subunit sigma-70 n=1 Tax=Gardnerella pickettii TaxID=2914924 RepID=UPI0039EF0F2F